MVIFSFLKEIRIPNSILCNFRRLTRPIQPCYLPFTNLATSVPEVLDPGFGFKKDMHNKISRRIFSIYLWQPDHFLHKKPRNCCYSSIYLFPVFSILRFWDKYYISKYLWAQSNFHDWTTTIAWTIWKINIKIKTITMLLISV